MIRIALSLGLGLVLFAAATADAGTTSAKLKRLAANDPPKNVLVERDSKLMADATSQVAPQSQDHCYSRY